MPDSAARFAQALAARYRIEREIGQGGMATVYLADDLRHNRKVAIKVLREDLAASMGSARFLREIQIAAQLQHPNILPLLDSGDTDGFLHYVMPFVPGQSLREKLSREGELPVHEAVRLLVEVTDALSLAHQHGVVHRDIKPDNVMLSGRHALVADFGVAKAITEATGRSTVTTMGVAVGTPTYMSPEQAAADPHIDHRSDIYAVGVMAYEMLTGRPPFTGATPQQVLAAHVTEAPESVARRRPAIPPALEQLVMRCLAKRPADRYQTADELLSQLEALATPSTGITPTQTRPVTASTPPAARGRRIAIVAGVAAIALGAAAIAFYGTTRKGGSAAEVQRVQATFSGRAQVAAASPDGQRIAVAERECGENYFCTVALVVQDIGGSGRVRATSEFAGIYSIDWSPDGRQLLFVATSSDGRFGTFAVPSIGGAAPRYLGPSLVYYIARDSVMMAVESGPDQLDFVAMHSLGEQGGDTVRVSRPGLRQGGWAASPDGRFIAMGIRSGPDARWHVLVTDRTGRPLDSMPVPGRSDAIGWTPQGGLVTEVRDTIASQLASVVVWELSAEGKLPAQPRVLLPPQPLARAHVSAAGITYTAGPEEAVIYEASRSLDRPGDLAVRRVTSTTGAIGQLISGDGRWHIASRTANPGLAEGVTEVAVIPFGGGQPRILGAPIRGVIASSRNVRADSIVFLHRDGPRARLTAFDLETGRTTDMGTVADTFDVNGMEVLLDGSIAWQDPRDSPDKLRIRARNGTITQVTIPPVDVNTMESSIDGHGTIGWGFMRPTNDSIVIFHLPVGSSVARRVTAVVFDFLLGWRWTQQGLVEIAFAETVYTGALYLLNPATGALRRVATIPLNDISTVTFSLDGTRLGLRVLEPRQDAWIARVFDKP